MNQPVLDPDEAKQALEGLSPSDLVRLRKMASYFALGSTREIDELISEAALAVLEGRRRCPRDLPMLNFLVGAVRSIASEAKRKQRNAPVTESLEVMGADGSIVQELAITNDNAEMIELRKEDQNLRTKALEEIFADDDEAMLVFWGLQDQMSKEEVMAMNDLDKTGYDTVRRRMRRKIDRCYPDGWPE